MRLLDMFGDEGNFDSAASYLKYYGLDFANEDIKYIPVEFRSNAYFLAGHIFEPREYKSVVFVLHGFLSHCGLCRHIIEYLIRRGYAVACYDMPGHGLSTGEPAGIEDFSEYRDALCDFVDAVRPGLGGPYHIIGYSLGGAVALDYLLTNEDGVFDKVVVAAPLVRSWLWGLSKVGYRLYKPFGRNIPRVFRRNSSDKEYLSFVKKADPLQTRVVPMRWMRALYEWNERISDLPPCGGKVKVIQGSDDTAVAWRFNVKFIRSKFSEVEVVIIKKGRHELFNESADIRAEVFSQIGNGLEN